VALLLPVKRRNRGSLVKNSREETMTNLLTLPPGAMAEYQVWLNTIKQRIVSVRMRMALAANRELILFYWDLGAMIAHKQAQSQWGDKLISQLSADL
jgi:hypothetical protein